MKAQRRAGWKAYGVRWEVELKKSRAHACAQKLIGHPPKQWPGIFIGILRAHINFRDTTIDASPTERNRAPLLGWWAELTQGFSRCTLRVCKQPHGLAQVRRWATGSLAPMLAVLSQVYGREYIDDLIEIGKTRWGPRHYRLMRSKGEKRTDISSLTVPKVSNRQEIPKGRTYEVATPDRVPILRVGKLQ
jgi:hypothetical protein